MPTPTVSETESANVVIAGFTEGELTEMHRGLVQRMSVAKSNMRDKSSKMHPDAWYAIYARCWSAYRKLRGEPASRRAQIPIIMDEHEYLTREP